MILKFIINSFFKLVYWKWHLMIHPVSRGVMYSTCSAISCTFLFEMPWAQWPHKRLSQTCLWMSRSLWRRCGSTMVCLGVRGTDYNNAGISPKEGTVITAIIPTIVWPHSPTHQQKIELKIFWAWLYPSGQDPDSPTSSPSHQGASTSFLTSSIREKT